MPVPVKGSRIWTFLAVRPMPNSDFRASSTLLSMKSTTSTHKMALGHPLEEPLKIYPVSDLVNSPRTDDARCIEPVRIDRDLFEKP